MRLTSPSRALRILNLVALALSCAAPARADDIDIFAGLPTDLALPNVLIVWDNSANWGADIPVGDCSFTDGGGPKATSPDREQGKKMAIEKCAIYNVLYALRPATPDAPARFNVGLMLFNESNADPGGYPRKQFVPLTYDNATTLMNMIRGIAISADKGNKAAVTATLHEAYLMFSRAAPRVGTQGIKWDPNAVAGGRYLGAPGNGCGRNHIIFVANGSPEDNNTEGLALLRGVGGNTTPLVYPSSYVVTSDQSSWADEYARFLRTKDLETGKEGMQAIVTHAIAVTGTASEGRYPNFYREIANQGGGQYYSASNTNDLARYLTNIFNSIQSVNTVFAAASLPISVNAQGTFRNQVFIGMFRPDPNARPRWFGNLKQYRIGYLPESGDLQLVDRLGNPALNSASGFFKPSAVSYWTADSTFWSNDLKGTPESASDRPDGEVVEKGAVSQRMRTLLAADQAPRRVFTCVGCPPGTPLNVGPSEQFVTGNALITSATLGVESAADREALIQWVRGNDNANNERGPGSPTTVRPMIHGDVLHSRPAVVDYGTGIGTVVFYGSNDGTLRAVNGNQTGTGAGAEMWSFVPEEFFGRLKRMRENFPEIRFPITPPAAYALPRDYFVDGPITVYQKRGATGGIEKVMIYATMRRGGRFLYAFDVTDPGAPIMKWRTSSSQLPVLGQTWSEARVARIRGHAGPVLIMGAGYDPAAEDAIPTGPTTMGNAVLVFDAFDGTLIRRLATSRSVPGAAALLDADYDGFVDRAYAADAGGNVYRVDFETEGGATDAGSWTIRTVASLNEAGATGTKQRKFFYAPDLVQTREFVAVQLGSGNRERPLMDTSEDRFYTLFDYKMTKGAPSTAPVTNAQLVPHSDDFSIGASVAGCYLPLSLGEKVVTPAVSTGGYTYFSTNRATPPAPDSCNTSLGVAKGYKAHLFCGACNKVRNSSGVEVCEDSGVESAEFPGGGIPPAPVVAEVIVAPPPYSEDSPEEGASGRQVTVCLGCMSLVSPLEAGRIRVKVDPTRRRVYWYTQPSR